MSTRMTKILTPPNVGKDGSRIASLLIAGGNAEWYKLESRLQGEI